MRVLGTPKPSIQWYKDDVEIFACDRIEIKEEDEGILYIHIFFSMSLKFALLAFIFLLNRIFSIYLLFSSLGEHEGKFAFVDL